jgi:hypothetical protein
MLGKKVWVSRSLLSILDSGTKQTKTRKLVILEFLWLILWHVLPKGLQRVRDYGLRVIKRQCQTVTTANLTIIGRQYRDSFDTSKEQTVKVHLPILSASNEFYGNESTER